MTKFLKKYRLEIACSMLCLTLGILSGYGVKAGDSVWYMSLNKPSFNPPNWIFGPVWTILYIMIGTAFAKILKSKNTLLAGLFIFQFALNLIWSPLFFYFQRIDLALLDISILWITLTMLLYKSNRDTMLLLLPYFIWCSFASVLNFSIYWLN